MMTIGRQRERGQKGAREMHTGIGVNTFSESNQKYFICGYLWVEAWH